MDTEKETTVNNDYLFKVIKSLDDFANTQVIINSQNLESENLQLKHNKCVNEKIKELEFAINEIKKSNSLLSKVQELYWLANYRKNSFVEKRSK